MVITGKSKFNFIDKRLGTTKDGEQYLLINVLSKDNKKFNFITKDSNIIDKISPLNLQRFAEITLILGFERVYNAEKRTSYWSCFLAGVE